MSNPKTYELGTAIKITTILSRAGPTSVTITIKNGSNITEIDAVAMTADTTTIYSYVYQSLTTDDEGTYKVIIDVTHGTYTSRAISEFILTDKDE